MKFYNYKTKCGLEVLFLKKPGFNKKYCAIGTKFGGTDLSVLVDGKEVKLKPGIAHFIEHKLFSMPDGSDALKSFTNMYASSNAYTANDKTIYYIKTLANVYKPLELLLKMYFTPHFTSEEVTNEKDIIISEILMYKDDPISEFFQKSLENTYLNEDYSKTILGSVEDVRSINEVDLLNTYNMFYTPKNSNLVVVGDLDENELFAKIETFLEPLTFSNLEVTKLSSVKNKDIIPYFEQEADVSIKTLALNLRIDELNNTDPILCEKLLGLVDSIINISCEFNQYLLDNDLYDGDIAYEVVTHKNGSYISFEANSKDPNLLANILIDKFNNLVKEDLNLEVLDLYLKSLKSKILIKEDSIDYLGEDIISLTLEDIDYEKMIQDVINIKVEDVISLLPYLKNALKTYGILKNEN